MVVKLARKTIPAGFQPSEFHYHGRFASDRGDFGGDVGIVDLIDERNDSTYFHAGIVTARGQWFVYIESGKTSASPSWQGNVPNVSIDFMFARCRDEQQARSFFRQQCMTRIWSVQHPHRVDTSESRTRGLASNCTVPRVGGGSDRGLAGPMKTVASVRGPATTPNQTEASAAEAEVPADTQPRVLAMANALVRGTIHDARSVSLAAGFIPTLETLERVGAELLPLALQRIAELSKPIGPDGLTKPFSPDGLTKPSKHAQATNKVIDLSELIPALARPMAAQQVLDGARRPRVPGLASLEFPRSRVGALE